MTIMMAGNSIDQINELFYGDSAKPVTPLEKMSKEERQEFIAKISRGMIDHWNPDGR